MIILGTSCSEDFLNVESQDSTALNEYYQSEDDIRNATAVLYGAYGWFDYVSGFMFYVGDVASGDMYYSNNYMSFGVTSDNTDLNSGWESLYRVNSYCNTIINNMPELAAENGVEEDVINKGLAEAKFIRAWVYFVLAEYWGEVPIIEDNFSMIESDNVKVNKNTQSSVYEFIRRDLAFATQYLPDSDDEEGRATKCAAQGLMAKLYLTMASDLSNTNSDTYFENAKAYADSAINNSGGFGMVDDYEDLFTIENNNNSESLFAIQMIGAGGYGYGNSRNVFWARSAVITDGDAWGAGIGATLDFQDAFEDGDVRRKPTFMLLDDYYAELDKADGGYTYKLANSSNNETYNNTLSNIKKYVVGSAEDTDGEVGTNQDAGNNLYFMRFSELYLIYCEAVIGAGESTSDATALNYINLVRERAGLSELEAPLTYDEVMQERRVEFGMESIRWYDIKRMYYRDAEATVDYLTDQNRLSGYTTSSTDEDALNDYSAYSTYTQTVEGITTEDIEALPIPTEAITSNPLLEEDAVAYSFD